MEEKWLLTISTEVLGTRLDLVGRTISRALWGKDWDSRGCSKSSRKSMEERRRFDIGWMATKPGVKVCNCQNILWRVKLKQGQGDTMHGAAGAGSRTAGQKVHTRLRRASTSTAIGDIDKSGMAG